MAKMIIMYEQPKDKAGFEEHYFNVHVPLGRKIPNIINDSVHHVIQSLNTNLDLYLITVLEFENIQKLMVMTLFLLQLIKLNYSFIG